MRLAEPGLLWWLLLVLPLLGGLYWWGTRRRAQLLGRIVAPRLREILADSVCWGRRVMKWGLIGGAVLFLFLALARPQHGFREVTVDRSGVDFLIGLDVSRSMLAEDAGGTNRLEAAKEGVRKLLGRLRGDRVGLMVFSGDAAVVAPLTRDHVAVERSLEAVEPQSVSERGSDLGLAIRLARETLGEAEYATKILLLISDGEQLQGDAILAAREAVASQMRVFAVGVGSRVGARIPEMRAGARGYVRNEFGREVVSRFDERVLRQVASNGRGSYAALGEDRDGLLRIYGDGLAPLATGKERRKIRDPKEYFQWPLGLALLLLLLEMLAGERRR